MLRYELLPSVVMNSDIDIVYGQWSTVLMHPVSMIFGVAMDYVLSVSGATATATKAELNCIRRPQAPGMLGLCELLTNRGGLP